MATKTTTKTKTVKTPKAAAPSAGLEALVYNAQGKEAGKVTLPPEIFGLPWNADLVHQVVTSMQANSRSNIAHTKDRGEVRGGGKKPWQQKGTGRARHGSSRSPIWKGGGVTHGPRNERNYMVKINRSMKQKALLVALSRKAKDGEVIVVDTIAMTSPKTAEASTLLRSLGKAFSGLSKKRNAAVIALPAADKATQKSFRNLGHVSIEEVRNLNPISVLAHKYVIIANPESSFETLGKKMK
jgi:large subunit ribosomal protein L4